MVINRWTRGALGGTAGLLGLVIAVFLLVATLANGCGPTASAASPVTKAKTAVPSTSPAAASTSPAPTVKAPTYSLHCSGQYIVNSKNQRFNLKFTQVYIVPLWWETGSGKKASWGPWKNDSSHVVDSYLVNYDNRAAQMDAMQAAGINGARLWFCPRMALDPYFTSKYYTPQEYIKRFATYCNDMAARGMYMIVGCNGGGGFPPTGDAEIKFMKSLLGALGPNHNWIYELTNEPDIDFSRGGENWNQILQRCKDTITWLRKNGYSGPIVIPKWMSGGGLENYPDSQHNVIMSYHQYDFGKVSAEQLMQDRADYSKKHNVPVINGEFQTNKDHYMDVMYDYVATNVVSGGVGFNWSDQDGLNMTSDWKTSGTTLNDWGTRFRDHYAKKLPTFKGDPLPAPGSPKSPPEAQKK